MHMSTQPLVKPIAPPHYQGFPYLVSNVVAGLHHIIPLPLSADFQYPRLRQVARIQAKLNQLPTCLVLSSEACLYIRPDLNEHPSSDIPSAEQIEWGKIIASEVFPMTDDLFLRYEMLQLFTQQLHSRQGTGYSVILGDVTKGGRPLQPGEETTMQGVKADGIPNGLSYCHKCQELRGECIDPKTSLVVQVSCQCENENLCAACLTPLYKRKLNANYYSQADGQIWHVPGYCALEHQCPQVIGSAPRVA
jgi:hypothetical protein